jgi:hypothetical protein
MVTDAYLVAAATDAPTHKDVVIAALGASAVLGGLAVVSLALVISAVPPTASTPSTLRAVVSQLARFASTTLVVCIADIAAAMAWLAAPGGSFLYSATLVLFGAQLIGIFYLTVIAVRLVAQRPS